MMVGLSLSDTPSFPLSPSPLSVFISTWAVSTRIFVSPLIASPACTIRKSSTTAFSSTSELQYKYKEPIERTSKISDPMSDDDLLHFGETLGFSEDLCQLLTIERLECVRVRDARRFYTRNDDRIVTREDSRMESDEGPG